MRIQKRPVSITRTLAGIAEEGKKGKVLNNWAPSDYRKSENKRDKMFFRRPKNSFKNRAMLLGLTIILPFCLIRRATADEINKILELGTVKVEIIQNKMSDQDAERLISYSKSLLDEGDERHGEAKKILEAIKIYNANKDMLDDVEYYIGKIHYRLGERYGTYAYQRYEEAQKEKGKTLKMYKKMCYLYPRSDVITSGKLARTLVNIIKKETETIEWRYDSAKDEPRPNFALSTYAFQILKYDYPKQSLGKTTLTQAKNLIDKMLDVDIGEKVFQWPHPFWEWYHIDIAIKVFGRSWSDLHVIYDAQNRSRRKEGLWRLWRGYYRNVHGDRREGFITQKGATLRNILKECSSLDPYSWTRQSSGEEKGIFE